MILVVNFILATVSLSLVHERLPDREKYAPLPDVVLDNIQDMDWALNVSEILIMIGVNSCIILIIFHKHRFAYLNYQISLIENITKRYLSSFYPHRIFPRQIHRNAPGFPTDGPALPNAICDNVRDSFACS